MKYVYDLRKEIPNNDFEYVYSPKARREATFEERADDGALKIDYCNAIGDFDYLTMLSKKSYPDGTLVSLKCRLYGRAAPLIVFTDEVGTGVRGRAEYKLHYEAVLYAGGINIWHILPCPENPPRNIKSTKLAHTDGSLADGVEYTLTAVIKDGRMVAESGGIRAEAHHPDMPKSFRVGFTACEGVCELIEFTIEDP